MWAVRPALGQVQGGIAGCCAGVLAERHQPVHSSGAGPAGLLLGQCSPGSGCELAGAADVVPWGERSVM